MLGRCSDWLPALYLNPLTPAVRRIPEPVGLNSTAWAAEVRWHGVAGKDQERERQDR